MAASVLHSYGGTILHNLFFYRRLGPPIDVTSLGPIWLLEVERRAQIHPSLTYNLTDDLGWIWEL